MRTFIRLLSLVLLSGAHAHAANDDRTSFDLEPIIELAEEQFMGQVQIDRRERSEVLRTEACDITHMQMRVSGADLTVRSLFVQYGDGSMEEVQVREAFEKGSTSRWIDLAGGTRCVRTVYLEATNNSDRRRATIQFFGKKDYTEQRLGRLLIENAERGEGLHLTNACGFTKVRMTVLGDSLTVKKLFIVYGNGEVDELQVRERFDRGQSSRWIDLSGNARCIEGVFMEAASGPSFRPTLVQFDGFKPQ